MNIKKIIFPRSLFNSSEMILNEINSKFPDIVIEFDPKLEGRIILQEGNYHDIGDLENSVQEESINKITRRVSYGR